MQKINLFIKKSKKFEPNKNTNSLKSIDVLIVRSDSVLYDRNSNNEHLFKDDTPHETLFNLDFFEPIKTFDDIKRRIKVLFKTEKKYLKDEFMFCIDNQPFMLKQKNITEPYLNYSFPRNIIDKYSIRPALNFNYSELKGFYLFRPPKSQKGTVLFDDIGTAIFNDVEEVIQSVFMFLDDIKNTSPLVDTYLIKLNGHDIAFYQNNLVITNISQLSKDEPILRNKEFNKFEVEEKIELAFINGKKRIKAHLENQNKTQKTKNIQTRNKKEYKH